MSDENEQPYTPPFPADALPDATPLPRVPARGPRASRAGWKTLAIGGGTAAAVVVAGAVAFGAAHGVAAASNTTLSSTALAARGPHLGGWNHGHGAILTVTGKSGANISATKPDGATVTVITTSATKFTSAGKTITFADIPTNAHIAVRGTPSADGKSITATDVAVVLPEAHGTVQSVSGNTITITTKSGTQKVLVSSATTFEKGPGQSASLTDVAFGDEISAMGTLNGDGSFTAQTVRIMLPTVAGKVTAKSGNTITVQTRGGTATFTVTSATTYDKGGQAATSNDIAIGDMVVAQGTKDASGALTATRVMVALPHAFGQIATVNGQTITITTHDNKTVTLHLTNTTTITDPQTKASVAATSLTKGEYLMVEGTVNADGSFNVTSAQVVTSLPAGGFGGHSGGPGDGPGGGPGDGPGGFGGGPGGFPGGDPGAPPATTGN